MDAQFCFGGKVPLSVKINRAAVAAPRAAEDDRMTEDFAAMLRRLDTTERNQTDLAKSVTSLVEDQRELRDDLNEIKTDRAVRAVQDKHLDERLNRIEKSIERVYNLGWWVLGAFGLTLIAAISSFVFKGGLNAP